MSLFEILRADCILQTLLERTAYLHRQSHEQFFFLPTRNIWLPTKSLTLHFSSFFSLI